MMNWDTFNQPQEPITPEDQLYAITYRVYAHSKLITSHIYAENESQAVERFKDWLGDFYSVSAVRLNFSIWNLRGDDCDWDMLCCGVKHRNTPLYSLLKD